MKLAHSDLGGFALKRHKSTHPSEDAFHCATRRTAPGQESRWQGAVATVYSGHKGRLAMLVDEASQQQFLVDTGSSYSILPHRSKEPTSGPRSCTADCSLIASSGVRRKHMAAVGRRFTWDFLLAYLALPIIGADFLWNFRLLMDLGEMQILAGKGC